MPPTDAELVALAERVGVACRTLGRSIATAESCTGGLVAHLLTEIPGSSTYFRGGLVTYANEAKIALAGVPQATVDAHGAVSAQVAVALAEGTRRRLGVDLAVAVTGIAGPDGGSLSKPVGLTYVAVADADGHDVRRHLWTGDRHANKLSSAAAALTMIARRMGSEDGPDTAVADPAGSVGTAWTTPEPEHQ